MFVASAKPEIKRLRLEISGVVQGVGFRPFVHAAARKFDLKGFVGNESAGVFIEVEGAENRLNNFIAYLKNNAPPLAHISNIVWREKNLGNEKDFRIIESVTRKANFTLISPDIAVCDDCLREVFDKKNRRFRYPFTNCTNCGPRFTITEKIPYDRRNTTMATFKMCAECQSEYENPLDRRFHAQPNACPKCGPEVFFEDKAGTNLVAEKAILETLQRLKKGEIIAVKGIGGFHLVCDARNENAVRILRERKGRADKPFAVMCKDSETARKYAEIGTFEHEILSGKERPIVLLKRKRENGLPAAIAPNNQFLGVMLPYSPLHYLLFDQDLEILVMTSGNLSSEPIVKDNDEARKKLAQIADAFLFHNREIFVQCDDSVIRIADLGFEIAGRREKIRNPQSAIPIRRSRGFAPFPVELPFSVPEILAVGGELKATFCLTKKNFAFMSQHIGDMENLETLRSFEKASAQMKSLFRVAPKICAGDLHPNYLSGIWARKNFAEFVGVQHHHAHIAAVMAENGIAEDEKVIGFAFDGTGYGTDGKIWGGEVLLADYADFARLAHLRYFPLPGGDVSLRNVYRLALSLLREAEIDWKEDLACVAACPATERRILQKQLENKLNTLSTSSFGRLFDAVASIANVRQKVTYEAQAAIEFESRLDESVTEKYEFDLTEDEIDYRNLIREIVADIRASINKSIISAKFHNAVADLILRLSLKYRKASNLNKIALSGGCFQNVALLRRAFKLLTENDFEILTHKKVPPNDGGLALGQAVIAAKFLEKSKK